MNITLLSFASSLLLSKSPLFVGNNINIIHGNFNKFTTLLLFNQQNFFIQGSLFNKGLSGIVKINTAKDINQFQKDYEDKIYGNYTIIKYLNHSFAMSNRFDSHTFKTSYTILDCSFIGIDAKNNENLQILIYFNSQCSIYISDTTFYNCQCINNLVTLEHSRCCTLTHICGKSNYVESGAEFLYVEARHDDFFILSYSTFIARTDGKSQSVIRANHGHQYHRCQNFSNFDLQGDQSLILDTDAPNCFSQMIITYNNIKRILMKISGNIKESLPNKLEGQNKTIECSMIACIGNRYDFYYGEMTNGNSLIIYFTDCFYTLNSNGERKNFFTANGNYDLNNYIILNNCLLDSNINEYTANSQNKVFFEKNGVQFLSSNNISHPQYKHYTNQYCDGPIVTDTSIANGCGVDDCFAKEKCNKTIGIPTDAAPYETIIHTDLQTASFTPTEKFSKSSLFSYSEYFSQSTSFSFSSFFTSSNVFSFSNKFSGSSSFSKSTIFTLSDYFSNSLEFSTSAIFSNSKVFSLTVDFTKSLIFTQSLNFSESKDFTKSIVFTQTTDFTKSLDFSISKNFSESVDFSHSSEFSRSIAFSETNDFSKTEFFSLSTDFTQSFPFTNSDNWNRTHTFSPSTFFSQSNNFSSSFFFSKSTYFTESKDFSKSISFSFSQNFSQTDSFTKSFYFTNSMNFDPTENFNQTHKFTPSLNFTKSNAFSESNKFSKSSNFIQTSDFTLTNNFTSSNLFTKSKSFSDSKQFSKSNQFTNSATNNFKTLLPTSYFSLSFAFSISKTLIQNSFIQIDIKQDDSHHISNGIKIGIGIAAGLVGVGLIVLGIIFFRKRKITSLSDFDEELITVTDDSKAFTQMSNPLIGLLSDDDPFKDEFD